MKKIFITIFIFCTLILKSYSNEISQSEMNILKNLRCLVCQGQSIADSNSDFAQTVKLVVKDQIKEGKSDNEIYEFLTSKYGEWIFYKPSLLKLESPFRIPLPHDAHHLHLNLVHLFRLFVFVRLTA